MLGPRAVLTPLAREKARAKGIEIEREQLMLRATVTGSVWATRRVEALPNGALLEVRTDDGATLIAFDVLGSGDGERVLVATGSVASGYFGPEHPPLDALIIGSSTSNESSHERSPRHDRDQGVRGRARGARTRWSRPPT